MSNPAQSNTDQQNATPLPRWTREEMAARVARDIPDGAVVNLGLVCPRWWPTTSPLTGK